MKVIIAGSRDITDFWKVVPYIKEGFEQLNIIEAPEIVSGCATGMDTNGKYLAEFCGYDLKEFPADWNKYGKAAGPIRNKQMANYADALICIHNNSKGSVDMVRQMRAIGKPVYEKIIDKKQP